ncbi:MAG: TadE/TadG family type IV pilus assembly protein [Thermoguttaceae bacterium]
METLELILVLPVLLILIVFCVQFAMVALFQSAVVHAATVGAREAGKGADLATVVEVVQRIVGVHCITIDGSGTKVVLEDSDSLLPAQAFGDPTLCNPPASLLGPNQVRVTVCVDLSATPFCNALANWGVTFAGRTLKGSSVVVKEYEQDLSVGGP